MANSHRPVAVGRRGMVSAAHPLASEAGLQVLMEGGNAVDAAVAIAGALNVVEPHMSGLAGIGWWMIYLAKEKKTYVINFSGCAPSNIKPELYNAHTKWAGMLSPAVPGNLYGWTETLKKFGTGKFTLTHLFQDAISYAENGIPLSQHHCNMIEFSREKKLSQWKSSAKIFLRNGNVPKIGELLIQKDLSETLRAVAENGNDYLYKGELGKKIATFCRENGGLLTEDDFREYKPRWEEPIEINYKGYIIRTTAPNSSAFQILEALNILETFDVKKLGHNTADYIHLVTEVGKLAIADRICYGADPDVVDMPIDGLISKEYAAKRRKLINPNLAAKIEGERYNINKTAEAVQAGKPSGLTTYFSVVDTEGNIVSATQTNGSIFGSGVIVEGTGVLLNNAINWFETDVGSKSPNTVAPGRRFEIPLAPVQVFRKEGLTPFLSIGTPGSFGIGQTTVQMLMNVLEFGMDIQTAIEAPRFKCTEGTKLVVEGRIPQDVRGKLTAKGHEVMAVGDWSIELGGAQGIMLNAEDGMAFGGADPRRDGYAVGY